MNPSRHLHAAAATLAEHFDLPSAGTVVVQLFVRDQRTSAHLVIDVIDGKKDWNLVDGKHTRPNLTLYLDAADAMDIHELGCTRGYVAAHGDERLASSFRSQFMSISPAGKRMVESNSALANQKEIERISANAISGLRFLEHYAVGSCPVVIGDAMPHWRTNCLTIDDLRAKYGDLDVHLRVGDYAARIYQRDMKTQVVKLGQYLERCASGTASRIDGVPEYGANNMVPLDWSEWLDYPPFVPRAICSYAKFWVGPDGTVTPMHRDWSDNFLSQLVGTKEVAMLPPHCSTTIAPRVVHPLLDSCNWVDPRHLDDRQAEELKPLFLTLNPGEMLFIPAGWFHHVRSTSVSFSVNFFLQRVPYAACPPRPSS